MISFIFSFISSIANIGKTLIHRKKKNLIPAVNCVRNNGKSAVIVLVHGFSGSSEETWSSLIKFLETETSLIEWDIYSIGYYTRLTPDIAGIWSADASIDTLSKLLSTVLGVAPLKDYKCFAILAHSMGGLVAQRMILNNQFTHKISHLALFGTPSLGLKKIGLTRFFKRQLRDMKSKSTFVKSVREEWDNKYKTSLPFKFISVHGELDEFVPSSSSLEPFSSDYQRVIPGNHITLIKPQSSDSVCVQLIIDFITGGASSTGPMNSALVAVELGQFRKAVQLFENHIDELDTDGLVQYALSLEGVGRREDALMALSSRRENTGTDGLGTLAGRFKRRWSLEHRESDGNHALSLYEEAYEKANLLEDHSQAYYLLINVVYMKLVFKKDVVGARSGATKTLIHCQKAHMNAWNLATQGESNLILGNVELALEKYRLVSRNKPSLGPRELRSMFVQAVQISSLIGADEFEAGLTEIFSQFPDVVTS